MIRIALADDHSLVRAGLRSLLSQAGDMEVVAEAEDGRQALEVVTEHAPDVLVLDLGLPELNGLEVIARLRRTGSDTRVLVLSMHDDREYVARAFREGASGYLVKDAAEPELEVAVRAVRVGRRYVSPQVAGSLVDDLLSRSTMPDDPFDLLTPRQREVLQLISEGHSTAEIGKKLHISVKTVESHRAELMRRLDIHDVAGLTRYAMRNRMTTGGDG